MSPVKLAVRERLDAHRVVEDFMIAANVAAAKALESKVAPIVYRIHEPPNREKLVALKDYLATFDLEFALGQVIKPATFSLTDFNTDMAGTKNHDYHILDPDILPLVGSIAAFVGAISAVKCPAACAAQARCWLRAPYSSIRSRGMPVRDSAYSAAKKGVAKS